MACGQLADRRVAVVSLSRTWGRLREPERVQQVAADPRLEGGSIDELVELGRDLDFFHEVDAASEGILYGCSRVVELASR